MRHIALVSFLAATLAAAPAEAQDARAAALLSRAREALGGEARLGAVKALQARGEFRRQMRDMQMEGELEVVLVPPDKIRRTEEISMPHGPLMTRTEVLNGADTWEDSDQRGGPGGRMMIMRGPGGNVDPERMKEMQLRMRRMDLARYRLLWLLATDAPVTHVGIAQAPDGTADVLEIRPADGPPMRLFIDQETHLPLMLTWQAPQPRLVFRRGPGGRRDGPPPDAEAPPEPAALASFEMRFSEYRPVNGVQLPHLITRGVNGEPLEEWTIAEYLVNPALKPETFTK